MTELPGDATLAFVRRYFDALERRDAQALADMFAPDVEQHELPNRLVPNGAVSDRARLLSRFESAATVITGERYVIERCIGDGIAIALEVKWSATLLVAIGTLAPGDVMRARFAVFIELREGRIWRQRNYDCFDPF